MNKKYVIFTDIISKSEVKTTVYLKLANSKEEDKVKDEN